jgi:non-canonical purine NTP pyrophosphatase (RdgB/HAM1 family)
MSQTPPFDLLIATSNPGKIVEIQVALRNLPVRLRNLNEFFQILPADEIGETYQENAIIKALSYSSQTSICALADDSGLEVDALGGLPGVRSARYGGEHASDEQRTEKLLRALDQRLLQERTARFVCSMALAGWPPGELRAHDTEPCLLHVCERKCEGLIISEPRGTNGFGYDPVFAPIGYDRTFGELPSSVKNVISHRAQALEAMRAFLKSWIAPT